MLYQLSYLGALSRAVGRAGHRVRWGPYMKIVRACPATFFGESALAWNDVPASAADLSAESGPARR